MTTNYGQQVYGQGPGTASTTLFDAVRLPRNPTSSDTDYKLGKQWVNTATNSVWYLATLSSNAGQIVANWVPLSSGAALVGIDTINTIPPDGSGNFTIESVGGTITITPEVNGISLDLVGGGATYEGNSGGLVDPNAGNTLFVVGNNSSGINVVGNSPLNTLTIVGLQSSTTQQGTVELATNAEAAARTNTFNALTPSNVPYFGQYSLFTVDPSGNTPYTTIQSAVTAAIAAGGVSQTVLVRPGTYTENLNLTGATALSVGLSIVGAGALGDEGQIEIIGHHTPPTSGTFIFRNFKLSDTTHIFTSSSAGSAHLVIIDAFLNVTNGYTFDLPNWTGIFELFDINNGTQNDGGVNNSGGASLFVFEAGLGSGTGQTMQLSGLTVCQGAGLDCPINFGTGSTIQMDDCLFPNQITLANNSTGNFYGCRFGTSSQSVEEIVMSSTGAVAIVNSIVSTSNNPSIGGSGTGTLTLDNVTFTGNKNIANTLTLADTGGLYPPGDLGPSGYVWVSNGVGVCPTFQSVGSTGATTTFDGDTGATTPTSLGVILISGGATGLTTNAASNAVTLGGELVVASGGTGNDTFTAYSVICAGTTATGAFQNVSGVGSAGQVLTSNGASALPTWQSGASTISITSVAHGASPYTVLSTDEFLACQSSGGTITIKLPNAPTTGRVIHIKDSNGDAATNNISVTTVGGSVTIDGQTTYTMATNYQSIDVIFDGTNYEVF